MSFYSDFRSFISRGNVIDMAVGIIVGASFTKIVDSLVKDILMPILGFIIGGIDLSFLKVTLKKASGTSSEVTIYYGRFINTIVDFGIIAFSVFILIKAMGWIYRTKSGAEEK